MKKKLSLFNQGFSLIEVLIAIAIVALIAVVALPLFTLGVRNIKSSEKDSQDLFTIQKNIEMNTNSVPTNGSLSLSMGGENKIIDIELYRSNSDEENISILFFDKIEADN